MSSTADNQTMDKLISGLKRGKYIQGLFDKTMKTQNSLGSMRTQIISYFNYNNNNNNNNNNKSIYIALILCSAKRFTMQKKKRSG